jgi:hypothetical protein
LFDRLHLRSALAEIFSSLGIDRESAWRVSARVRVLLGNPAVTSLEKLAGDKLWADGDFRWLACLSESGGVTYVNKECFEELTWWLQVPALIRAAGLNGDARAEATDVVERFVGEANAAAESAGYDLAKLLAILSGSAAPETEDTAAERDAPVVNDEAALEREPDLEPDSEPEPAARG